jgi:glucose/arabinose dehydrogenase
MGLSLLAAEPIGDWMRSAGTKLRLAVIAAGLAAILLVPARAGAAVALQPVGNFNQPLFVTSPPGDPRLFVVERNGTIQVLHDGTQSQILDITSLIRTSGEQGLLSMAFDPSFASNGLFYVFFNGITADPTVGDIHVDEFQASPPTSNSVNASTRRKVLTVVRGDSSIDYHNGGQLQFGPDGLLYISIGDNGNMANAQSTGNLHGKLLRINPHGVGSGVFTIPPDNPFAGGTATDDPIWSDGLRNPFRFSFDHLTGDLLIGDVGAGAREEVDFSPAASGGGRGVNYGWACREGFIAGPAGPGPCTGVTLTDPVFDYGHSAPFTAIIGGYVYRGNQIPELFGRYVYTDLGHPGIRSLLPGLPLASDDRSEGVNAPSNPNSFGEDSSCQLYVMGSGVVDRIVSTSPPAVAPSCGPPSATPPTATGPQTQPFFQSVCKKHKKHRSAEAAKKRHKKKHCKKKKKKKHVRAV